MADIHNTAPYNSTLTPIQNAVRLGLAATDALLARTLTRNRKENTKKRWVTFEHDDTCLTKADAWRVVECMESDYLPNFTEKHLLDFKVNQFCDACQGNTLCATHKVMKCNDLVDLTQKHFSAVKVSGHCIVECGGEGDCFYHSMMFLAQMFRQDLYKQWGSHDKLRRDTCEKLLV